MSDSPLSRKGGMEELREAAENGPYERYLRASRPDLILSLFAALTDAEQRAERYREALLDCKAIAETATTREPVWALPNKIAARVTAAWAAAHSDGEQPSE